MLVPDNISTRYIKAGIISDAKRIAISLKAAVPTLGYATGFPEGSLRVG